MKKMKRAKGISSEADPKTPGLPDRPTLAVCPLCRFPHEPPVLSIIINAVMILMITSECNSSNINYVSRIVSKTIF